MYSHPSKVKAATVGGRSTKNDDRTAHGRNPEDPTWTRTGVGYFVTLRNGKKYLVPNSKEDAFIEAYKAANSPGDRNAVVRKYGNPL